MASPSGQTIHNLLTYEFEELLHGGTHVPEELPSVLEDLPDEVPEASPWPRQSIGKVCPVDAELGAIIIFEQIDAGDLPPRGGTSYNLLDCPHRIPTATASPNPPAAAPATLNKHNTRNAQQ